MARRSAGRGGQFGAKCDLVARLAGLDAGGTVTAALLDADAGSRGRPPPRRDNAPMSDDSQILVPPSFVALFVPPGRLKPTEPREHIAARYELCEDLAQMLVETAQTQRWRLGVTGADVLERIAAGLPATRLDLSAPESQWVMTRLAELIGPDP